MNIGIVLRYGFRPETGGGFSYYDTLLSRLLNYRLSHDNKFVFFSAGQKYIDEEHKIVPLGLIPDRIWPLSVLARNIRFVKLCFLMNTWFFKSSYLKQFKKHNIKLLYYINQDDFLLTGMPHVMTVWDMGMRITYPFPELINGRNFKVRNRFFNENIHKALMVFAESESGKNDLIKYANVPEEKIKVLPIFAGNVINVRVNDSQMHEELSRIGVKEFQYFFYPAQFWAHKNHITVLKAFSYVVKNNPSIKLVFTGSDKSNKKYVENYCRNLGVDNNVVFLGFVSNDALYTLYKNATALVMASYFGETNMPPIEAMNIGCPVICSDIPGHREILGNAGLYFKAWDYMALKEAMIEVNINNDTYRTRIGERNVQSKFKLSDSITLLDKYLYEACLIREAWE